MNNMNKPKYGIVESGQFGARIISGIVTGIRYTEDRPMYEISFGKSSWWTPDIADTPEEVFELLRLPTLDRVREMHGLSIKYGHLTK